MSQQDKKSAKMRGQARQLIVLTVLAVIVLVSYKTVMDNVAVSNLKSPYTDRRKGIDMLEDVSELMPLTQPKEHLERMREHEKQLLNSVKTMIHHKEQQAKMGGVNPNAASNFLVKPSLINGMEKTSKPNVVDESNIPHHVLHKRFVHLDLKGAPPTIKYIRELFPFLQSIGATGLLIEYEDMFPYWGRLTDIRADNAYTVDEIKELNQLAVACNLEVIPLIQTFGHMEFILKRDTFKSLREVPSLPQAICPSNNNTLPLIYDMIDQTMSLHPNVQRLHIGCDEVYNIGECPVCQERMEHMHWGTEDLLLNHIKTVSKYIKERHNSRAIVWDDMFRKVPGDIIRESEIGKVVDIVVWYYQDDFSNSLSDDVWLKYGECFQEVWIASAFKGAVGPSTIATPIEERLQNHVGWMNVVQKYYSSVRYSGIFLTGWQRFDHFATLCELLPAGLPSLAVNLRYLQSLTWTSNDEEHVQHALGCYLPLNLYLEANGFENHCSFPGSRIYELAMQFYTLVDNLNSQFFQSNYVKGWVSDYSFRTSFSSPALLEQAMMRYMEGYRNLTFFQMSMHDALQEVYDKYTVNEWLETNVRPLMTTLDNYNIKIKTLLLPNTWPRRPILPQQPQHVTPSSSSVNQDKQQQREFYRAIEH